MILFQSWLFFGVFFFFWFFWLHRVACGILAPWPGIEPALPAVEACSLNRCTAGDVPQLGFVVCYHLHSINMDREFRKGSDVWFLAPVSLEVAVSQWCGVGGEGGASGNSLHGLCTWARLGFLIAWWPQCSHLLTCQLKASRASIPANKVEAALPFMT